MRHAWLTLVAALSLAAAGPAAAEEEQALPHQHWSFSGLFGTYDQASLRRGFEVYRQVCSNCHSMRLLAYRDLSALGYSEDEIKQIAASIQIQDGPNDAGDMFERPGRPYDHFRSPFANDQAARAANNGALPPDLSLMAKARAGGPDYIYAIQTGYEEPPPGFTLQQGMNYNKAFAGHQIAMPPPLADNTVTFPDGTPATLQQEAHDVASFLMWAAEPKLDERKRMGVKVMLFLTVLTLMLYAVKRKVWAELH